MTFSRCGLCGKIFLLFVLVTCARADDTAVTKESIYTTCNFDLEFIELLLPQMPVICREVYNKRLTDPQLYQSYLEESRAFAKFSKKLDDYELGPQHNPHEELEKYPFDKELRSDIYQKANWADCVSKTNDSAEAYLKCVTGKRRELEQLVPPSAAS